MLLQAAELRNIVQHYELRWSAKQLDRLIRQLFALIVRLCYSVFDIRIAEYYAWDERNKREYSVTDTVRELLTDSQSDTSVMSVVAEWRSRNPEDDLLLCLGCGATSASIGIEKCILCGEDIDPFVKKQLLS